MNQAKDKPVVSVVTSTYARSSLLRRAIASVRAQTLENWEMCIVGDCTPDDTEQVIDSFHDKRLKYYNLTEKSPIGAHGALAKNYAVRHLSEAPYISYLDDDDVYCPDMLEIMTDYMVSHPECEVAYCRGGYIDRDTGKKIWGNPLQRWLHGYSYEKLKRYNFINTNWVMHKKELLERVGYWNEKTFFDDYDLWLKMGAVTEFHYINRVMVYNYIREQPFAVRMVKKVWGMIKHGGRHMPLPYDGDYESR